MPDTLIVNCSDVELDSGGSLRDLGRNDHLVLDRPMAGMTAGVWQLRAFHGEHEERAEMRRMTAAEVDAARHADAVARIYE